MGARTLLCGIGSLSARLTIWLRARGHLVDAVDPSLLVVRADAAGIEDGADLPIYSMVKASQRALVKSLVME